MNLRTTRPSVKAVLAVSLFTYAFYAPEVKAQDLPRPSLYTAEMVNGRFWKALDESGKLSLLRGAADAIEFLLLELGACSRPSIPQVSIS